MAHTQPPLWTPELEAAQSIGMGFVLAPVLPFHKEQQDKNGLHSPDEM